MRVLAALAFALTLPATAIAAEEKPFAIFAGGCFWSMEKAFEHVPGVVSATSGYTGGTVPNPTYDMVTTGATGHVEAVKVVFDPAKIGYAQLLDIYWHDVDLTNPDGQFCDFGPQYRSEIFYADDAQRQEAEKSKAALAASGRFRDEIVTQIRPAEFFYPAEDYHQDFADKNPDYYQRYRIGCRRDARLARIWGDRAQ